MRKFWKEGKKKKFIWSKNGKKSTKWTELTLGIFTKIGMMRKKDIGKEKYKVEDSDMKKEFMSIDQVWFDKETDEPIVAIESENRAKFDEVKNDEFRKLLNIKSEYKILIWYKWPGDKKYEKLMDELQEKIDDHSKTEKECFIIITMEYDVVDEDLKTKWSMYSLRKKIDRSNPTIFDIDFPKGKVN